METLASLLVLAACLGVGWALVHLRLVRGRLKRVEREHGEHGERLGRVEERQTRTEERQDEHERTIEPLRKLSGVLSGREDTFIEEAPRSRRAQSKEGGGALER